MRRRLLTAALASLVALPMSVALGADDSNSAEAPVLSRNGQEIFNEFLDGRADQGCDADASNPRWERQFSKAPAQLADRNNDVLPLFGYVVDQLRDAGLPTEFALIPFIESGYHPEARNRSGPAGLWQFINSTARNHHVAMTRHYDGRLSAVESTAAAVRYLKTLYGMFGGDWRLALMAYNAGEHRVLQSMRQAGVTASTAEPAKLPGLSNTSYAYVEKLHALACVLDRAQSGGRLMNRLDRDVPILEKYTMPAGANLEGWAYRRALEPQLLDRLNPALGNISQTQAPRPVLAPKLDPEVVAAAATASSASSVPASAATAATSTAAAKPAASGRNTSRRAAPRRHTVRAGESAWSIAHRYHMGVNVLLRRNHLTPKSVIKPGMVLTLD